MLELVDRHQYQLENNEDNGTVQSDCLKVGRIEQLSTARVQISLRCNLL